MSVQIRAWPLDKYPRLISMNVHGYTASCWLINILQNTTKFDRLGLLFFFDKNKEISRLQSALRRSSHFFVSFCVVPSFAVTVHPIDKFSRTCTTFPSSSSSTTPTARSSPSSTALLPTCRIQRLES